MELLVEEEKEEEQAEEQPDEEELKEVETGTAPVILAVHTLSTAPSPNIPP